jgi:hypothetical protein
MRPSHAATRATRSPLFAGVSFALLAALVATALGACGTILEIAPDDPLGGEGGTDAPTTAIDGDVVPDFDGGDASIACGLSVDTTTVGFGDVITGTVHTQQITISSVLDSPTSVAVAITGAGFASPTSFPVAVAANGTGVFDVAFAASVLGLQAGTATLTWAGGCGITIPLSATSLAAGSITVSPATLNLGSVECGLAPPNGFIHVESATSPNWMATIVPGSGPFISAGMGTLSPPATDIQVSAGPLLPKEDPKTFTADLTLQITGEAPRVIHLTTTSLGGNLTFQPNDVTLTKAQPSRTIALVNSGTQAVRVNLSIDPPFSISASGSTKVIVLPGGLAQAQPVTVSTVTATSGSAVRTAKVSPLNGFLCAAGPLTVRQ